MRQHVLRRGLLLLGSLRLLLSSSCPKYLRRWGRIIVLLERDLLALEAAAASTATTESTASATTATEAATSTAVSEATAASTATTTAAESTTAAATSATTVVWSAAGKVQTNSTALKVSTLELFDNLLGVLNGVEGDVTETFEPSGFPKAELA